MIVPSVEELINTQTCSFLSSFTDEEPVEHEISARWISIVTDRRVAPCMLGSPFSRKK
ncbi:hypothetical protein DPMN_039788 [Dreissena polymorpha]|uniref:Uncharacterized protein n=1 Tax=Dreissena polymorpha TaxID=45954 RepID=A0A9D4CVL6_DREPO|nr:hypothetical protein DPMN_039788 [Dreissena polymorpha]